MKNLARWTVAAFVAAFLATAGVVAALAAPTPRVNAAASAPAESPKHTDPGRDYYKDAGFSFLPPEGWVKGNAARGLFLFYTIPPAGDGFMINMNANVQPAGDANGKHERRQQREAGSSLVEMLARSHRDFDDDRRSGHHLG